MEGRRFLDSLRMPARQRQKMDEEVMPRSESLEVTGLVSGRGILVSKQIQVKLYYVKGGNYIKRPSAKLNRKAL